MMDPTRDARAEIAASLSSAATSIGDAAASLRSSAAASIDALASPPSQTAAPPPPEPPSRTINIVVGTWNLGNKVPDSDLTQWLQPGADIYAVCCQEQGYHGVATTRASHWFNLVEAALGAGSAPLCRVGTASLGNIHVLVLCSHEIRPSVANVEAASEAMGLGGVGANKGVAAVSLLLGSTPLCFVGGHLAAHEGMEAKRAANLRDMERAVRLGGGGGAAAHAAVRPIWGSNPRRADGHSICCSRVRASRRDSSSTSRSASATRSSAATSTPGSSCRAPRRSG